MSSRIELVRSRKGFYRDNYNRICIGVVVTLSVILVFSVLLAFLAVFRPIADVYATSMDGQLIRLVSLDSPNPSE